LRGDLLRDLGESELSVAAFRDALELADGDTERCHAQIGLVAGLRVLDRYDEALAVLDEAEAAAHRAKLSSELAQIHYYRGNIFFPMGRIEGCRDQHALALQWAHLTGSVKAEARALSGLGDAEYLRGRMATACDLFRRCVALCRKHGFGRIAVPNAAMVGFTRHYLLEAAEAVADGEAALEAAARVGHHRAEMMANFLIGLVLIDKGEPVLARASVERSQALARRLGARRFEAQNLLFFAMCDRLERRTDRLGKLLGEARDISREVGDGFVGPRIMSELAFHAGNGAERRRLLAEGEAMLAAGSVSHNHLWFHRSAIEASLLAGDWDEAERYAAALAAYTAAEPLPWSNIFIALGQAGARAGRRPDDAAARAELERLAAVVEGAGLRSALPPMQAMLAQAA
jgi:tetratricopeptide (TPR) repeat protein